jgi:hypothetical protein
MLKIGVQVVLNVIRVFNTSFDVDSCRASVNGFL